MKFKVLYFAVALFLLPLSMQGQTSHKSVVRLSPATLFYGGLGGGLSYEHFLDREKRVSLMLPISFGMREYMIGSNTAPPVNGDLNYSFLFNPGVRMYPKGQRKVSYAIGASLFATYGTENGFKKQPTGSYTTYSKGNEIRLGSLISNSLTVNISNRFNIGFEALLGCSFQTRMHNSETKTTETGGVQHMLGLALQLGYRF